MSNIKRYVAVLMALLLVINVLTDAFPFYLTVQAENSQVEAFDDTEESADLAESNENEMTELPARLFNSSVTTSFVSGAEKIDDTSYVWNAPEFASGHELLFNVQFATSMENTAGAVVAPGTLRVKIPRTILLDREGNEADTIEVPYRQVDSGSLEDITSLDEKFVYYIEDDAIIVTNGLALDEAPNGYFDVKYTTTKATFEYRDYDKESGYDTASNPFFAQISENGGITYSEPVNYYIYINTTAQIQSVTKGYPTKYDAWQTAWGANPSGVNGDDSYYLVWEIASNITDPTQPYSFSLTDDLLTDGEVVAYRMAGKNNYVPVDADGKSSPVVGTGTESDPALHAAGHRYDYVITKHSKASLGEIVRNKITATVTPADGVDAPTTKVSSRSYQYIAPSFNGASGSVTMEKYGNERWSLGHGNKWEYASYDLANLQSATNPEYFIGGLKYNIHANIYPYPWTLEEGASIKDHTKYGKNPVTYTMTDEDLYLFGENDEMFQSQQYTAADAEKYASHKLEEGDYTFASLEYKIPIADATFNETSQQFDKVPHSFDEKDVITWYVKTWDHKDWVLAAKYNLGTQKLEEGDEELISKISRTSVVFGEGVSAFKAELSNPYYNTTIDMLPVVKLFSTEHVKELAKDQDNQDMVVLKNAAQFTVTDVNGQVKSKIARIDGDRIRKVQVESELSKRVISSANDFSSQIFTILWEVEQAEIMTSDANQNNSSYVQQNGGVFYDLLPKGATLKKGSMVVKVKETPGSDETKTLEPEEYTVTQQSNYKKSGRTLVTVKIDSQQASYTLHYSTLHSWEDLHIYGKSVLNPVAYETGNDSIAKGYPDDGGNLSAKNKKYYIDLDAETEDNRFIYAEEGKALNLVTAALAGLQKKTKASEDERWTSDTTVCSDETYQYRLRYANSENVSMNHIVLYDTIESHDENVKSEWNGEFLDIDISQIEDLNGANPEVYISTESVSLEAQNADHSSKATAPALASIQSGIWTRLSEFKGERSEIKMIAIKLDEDFHLNQGQAIVAEVYMKAPDHVLSKKASYPITYNKVHLAAQLDTVNEAGEITSINNYMTQGVTTVNYHMTGSFVIHKVSADDEETVIPGISFRITGTSDYGNEVNETRQTSSKGNAVFKNLEQGTYTLQEIEGIPDYLEDHTEYTVRVDNNGIVYVTKGNEKEERVLNSYIITNQPRIHTDVTFYKKSLGENNLSLSGAVFRLTGTSDYGNDVSLTVQSDSSGKVVFGNVEKGNYELEEITAPEGYIKATAKWSVKIDQNSITSIQGDMTEQNAEGDIIIRNEEYHRIAIFKQNARDNSVIEGAKFRLWGTSAYGTAYDKTVTSASNGLVMFEKLESGTYLLQEVEAPENFRLDDTQRVVTVQNDGKITIQGIPDDGEGNFIITNQEIPAGQVVVTKKWVDEDDGSKRSTPTLHLEEHKGSAASNALDYLKDKVNSFFNMITGTIIVNAAVVESVKVNTSISDENRIIGNPANESSIGGMQVRTAKWDVYKETDEKGKVDYVLVFSPVTEGTEGRIDDSNREWQLDSATLDGTKLKNKITKVRFEGEMVLASGNNFLKDFIKLEEIDFTNLDTSKSKALSGMFWGCSNLKSVDISQLDTRNVTDMSRTFLNCTSLTDIKLSGKNVKTDRVTNFIGTFFGCSSLKTLDLSSWSSTSATAMNEMFRKCIVLEELNLSGFSINNNANMDRFFDEANQLKKIYLGDNFQFNNNAILPNPPKNNSDYSGSWTNLRATNTDSYTAAQVKTKFNTKESGRSGWWYWQVSASSQVGGESYTSIDRFYNPSDYKTAAEREAQLASYAEADANGNRGYWQKLDDNTWTYTFYIYNTDENQKWDIWEDAVAGYVTSYEGVADGKTKLTLEHYKDSAVVVNTADNIANRTYGNLNITKLVTGENAPDTSFHFTIQMTNVNDPDSIRGTKTFGEIPFVDGVASVSLKANQTLELTHIPTGTAYVISEEQTEAYTLTDIAGDVSADLDSFSATGSISQKDSTDTVTFTNTYESPVVIEPVSITLEKILAGDIQEEDKTKMYSFKAVIGQLEPNASYDFGTGEVTTNALGEATIAIELKGRTKEETANEANQKTLTNIPVGASYQITEVLAEALEEATTSYLASYEVTDKKDLSLIEGIAGTAEKENQSLSTAVERADEKEEIAISFTNTITHPAPKAKTASLILEKRVVDSQGNVKNDDKTTYDFELSFSGLTPGAELESTIGQSLIKADGAGNLNVTYSLKNGERVELSGITDEARYTVVEKANVLLASYMITQTVREDAAVTAESPVIQQNEKVNRDLSTAERSIDADTVESEQITFTNKMPPTGTIAISKTVTGNMANYKKEFTFHLTLKDEDTDVNATFPAKVITNDSDNRENTKVIFLEGKADIVLKHNQTLEIQNIPSGLRYTVTEADYTEDGYQLKKIQPSIQAEVDSVETLQEAVVPDENQEGILAKDSKMSGEVPENATVKYVFTNDRTMEIPTRARTGLSMIAITIASGGAIWFLLRKRRKEKV